MRTILYCKNSSNFLHFYLDVEPLLHTFNNKIFCVLSISIFFLNPPLLHLRILFSCIIEFKPDCGLHKTYEFFSTLFFYFQAFFCKIPIFYQWLNENFDEDEIFLTILLFCKKCTFLHNFGITHVHNLKCSKMTHF
jgi:hypothetical protein